MNNQAQRTFGIRSHVVKHSVAIAASLTAAVTLAGCSSGALTKDFGVGTTATTAHYTGSVYGGQQPISGATIQLYAVSATLQGASTALITQTPTSGQNLTNANGNFNITGLYTCPVTPTDVYVTAVGGDGISAGQSNTATVLMAALGDCATLQANAANIFINMDELTTVAAAYALRPFAADYAHIGSSNATALTNSFNTAAELVSIGLGIGPGNVPPGGSVQTTQINTLGDIIASCVNTSGPSSMQCSGLLGTTGASDTFGALLAIAGNPGNATYTALYSLPTGIAPFQPSATAQPNDFTIAVNYTASSGLASPFGIALDGTGNAWVANEGGTSVTELSPNGKVLANATAAGLFGPQGIAVDRTGNVWVANTAGNSIVKFTVASGTVTGSASYTVGGVTGPTGLALDSANNVFVSNYNGSSVTELTSAGAAASGSPFTAGGVILNPSGIAIDSTGAVLVTSGKGSVVKLTNAGALSATLTDNATQGPLGVAVDGSNNVFASGSTTGTAVAGAVAEFSSAAAASTISPLAVGATPFGVASDGTYAYIANSTATGGIVKLQYGNATTLSPANGFGYAANYDGTNTAIINTPTGLAVDASGNLWSTNTGNNTVSKFVGLAKPVTTPLSTNVGP